MVKEHPLATEAGPRLLALATAAAAALLLLFLSIPLHAAAAEQRNWITVGNDSSSWDTAINTVNGNIAAAGAGGGGAGGGFVSLTISHAQPELEGWFEMASDMVGSAVLRRRRLADGLNIANVANAGKAACGRDKNGLYTPCTTDPSLKYNPQKCDAFTRPGC